MSQMQPPDSDPTSEANIDIQHSEQNNIVQGDRNIQGDGNQQVSVTDHGTAQFGEKDNVAGDKVGRDKITINLGQLSKRPNAEQVLLKAVATEVSDRLNQSLHHAVLINLPKDNQRERVRRPWDGDVKIGTGEKQPIPHDQSVFEVFSRDTISGKLLILGEPGSGKTTTMLDLARELIQSAQDDPDAPIPVLFNLSSWRKFQPSKKSAATDSIAEWMARELNSKYGVSRKLGQEWLAEQKLLPLLDGLDEVASERQVACLLAINQFLKGEQVPPALTICCREEEYDQLITAANTRLNLNGAICLRPLNDAQVKNYLTTLDCADLWSTLQQDEQLLELIKTPLWLSLSVLARKELDLESWSRQESLEQRRTQLLDGYVRRMLHDCPVNSRAYQGKNVEEPEARQTRRWLIWLAKRLQEESQDEFLIEQMQPKWMLKTPGQWWKYRLIVGLIVGLIAGLGGGLIGGLVVGLIVGLDSIDLVESFDLSFSRKEFFQKLIGGLKSEIQTRTLPNQGIIQSAKNTGVLTTLGIILTLVLYFGLWAILPQVLPEDEIPSIDGTFSIIALALWLPIYLAFYFGGGLPCIQHFSLRLTLYSSGSIPWNYARFLNYCSDRLLLQRIGGRYRFIHKLVQEHFAAMPEGDLNP
ncbi:MAG: NACHT domain-containing protein [Elainellaceae cyanobacterium]